MLMTNKNSFKDFFSNILPLGNQGNNSSSEVVIIKEETIEDHIKREDANAKRLSQRHRNIAGLSIITITLIVCLIVFLFYPDNTPRFETSEKLIFLIIGSILGFLYGKSKE